LRGDACDSVDRPAGHVYCGCVRAPWVVALLFAILTPMPARSGPPCLPSCDPRQRNNDCCVADPVFGQACGDYLGRRAAERDALDDSAFAECIVNSSRCQPTSPGRCTVILGCVEDCRERFGKQVPEKRIQREAFGALTDCNGMPLKAAGRRFAARTCRRCAAGSVTTSSTSTTTSTSTTSVTTSTSTSTSTLGTSPTSSTTTVTSTTAVPTTLEPGEPAAGDRCFTACLRRLDSVDDCYDDCADACEGDRIALEICRRSCRNASCLAVKAKCTINENNKDQIDPQYLKCCSRQGDCRDPGDAACEVTTTSTSTSTTRAPTTSTNVFTTTTSDTTTTLF
jgi:hypothetical protein